ncbi:MAG TPA: cytochrome c peroxidase [Candidatus Hydrogenedentes bacterium]|nr:cytochrome c peroxidase [Candidatus Hydrogenedentota bacterium]HOL75829.1 cytochrome c peroxidase [Candidatus Hydrogenedentota bacterium]HPO86330.1 cytochrome c peroxidase [Candidatus Hydrogenedentota bacterium]
MKTSRLIGVVVLLVVIGALALPISNLIVGLPGSNSLINFKPSDPLFAEAAAILGKKCVNCHTEEYVLPFYARFPIARGIIEKDIKDGLRYINYKEALVLPEGQPASEVVLAKTEYVLEYNTMPPLRYAALHWEGKLSRAEKGTVLRWVKETRKKHYATPGFPENVQEKAVQPIPVKMDLDPRAVALGDKLYHDKRLSKDNTIACASCHALDKGGTDQAQFSKGVGDAMGDINAPTTFNSGFQFMQFWDGRAANLEEQADGPVNNPIEMASNWPEAIGKLSQDEALTAEFTAVYPEGYSKETITSAIATFERSLITPNSKFDKYLAGDASALNATEQRGYQLFLDLSCATCHVGKLLGGQSFERMGVKKDYFAARGNVIEADYGRFKVTKKEDDRFKLKVPTLRNIALTHPYFHDGTAKTLEDAVKVMAEFQLGKNLTSDEVTALVAFMNTLTGEYNGKPLQ